MGTSKEILLLLLAVVARTAFTVTAGSRGKHCTRECSQTPLDKYQYEAGKTYHHSLSSSLRVRNSDQQDQTSTMQWTADVDLHFDNPCEVTLDISNVKLEGEENPTFSHDLSAHPVKAVLVNGVFEEVCVSEEDSHRAINIKKGILSSLQISLPSLTTEISDGATVRETDVVGICPSVYRVSSVSSGKSVEKVRMQHECKERYGSSNKSPLSAILLKSNVPTQNSSSTCTSIIEKGIIQSVDCQGYNRIVPYFTVESSLIAEQASHLKFVSTSTGSARQIPNVRATNLLYDYAETRGNLSALTDAEQLLRRIVSDNPSRRLPSAKKFRELVHLLDKVPDHTFTDTLKNIRQGHYGSRSEMLERFYLDAVRATSNTGAMKVLVDEVLQGKNLLRNTWSIFSAPVVCSLGVEALKQVFEHDTAPMTVTLAAGTALGTFCRSEGYRSRECLENPQFEEVMSVIARKLESSCGSSQGGPQETKKTVTLLKALGNIRQMDGQVAEAVSQCCKVGVEPKIMIAAAEALKMGSCRHQAVSQLLEVAMDTRQNTQVRIDFYKAAIQCASSSQISRLLQVIRSDNNNQVTSYMLSDMRNLQKSTSPDKIEIQQRLAPFDLSKGPLTSLGDSVNYDFSNFNEYRNVGSELDIDLIFEEGSKILKEIKTNFTMEVLQEMMSVIEVGAQFEDLPKLLINFLEKNVDSTKLPVLKKIVKYFLDLVQQDSSSQGEADYFMKLLGSEVFFGSTNLSEVDTGTSTEVEAFVKELKEFLGNVFFSDKGMSFYIRRALEIPTIQGIPLYLAGDFVHSSSLNRVVESERTVEVSPSLSSLFSIFVGYNFGPKVAFESEGEYSVGNEQKMTIAKNSQDVSLKFEFPKNSEDLVKVSYKSFFYSQSPGKPAHIIGGKGPVHREPERRCFKSIVEICVEMDIEDVKEPRNFFRSKNAYGKLILKKSDSSVKSYEVKLTRNDEKIQGKLFAHGSGESQMIDVDLRCNMKTEPQEIDISLNILGSKMGIKALRKLSSDESNLNAVEVFATHETLGNSEIKMMDLSYGRKRSGSKVFKIKSYPSTTALIDLSFDFDIETLPEPGMGIYRLKKFDTSFTAGGLRSKNFIKIKSIEQNVYEWDILSATSFDQNPIAAFETTGRISNKMDQIRIETDIKGEYFTRTMNTNVLYELTKTMQQVQVQVIKDQTNKVVSISGKIENEEALKVFTELNIPSHEMKWNVFSKIEHSPHEKHVKVSIQNNDKEVLTIQAPIYYLRQDEEVEFISKINMKLPEAGKTFFFDIDDKLKMDRIYTKFIINEDTKTMFAYAYDLKFQQRGGMSLLWKIQLPRYLDSKVEFFGSQEHIDIAASLQAPIVSHRKIDMKTNLQRGTPEGSSFTIRLLWDAERDPTKLVSITGIYKTQNNHFMLHGKMDYDKKVYEYDVSHLLDSRRGFRNFTSDLNLEVLEESTVSLKLRFIQNIDWQSAKYRLDNNVALQLSDQKHYTLAFKAEGDSTVVQPYVNMDGEMEAPSLGELEYRLRLNTEGLKVRFAKNMSDATSSGNQDSSNIVLDFSISILTGETGLSLSKNDVKVLQLKCLIHPSRDGTEIIVETPSNTAKLVVALTFDIAGFAFFPSVNDLSSAMIVEYKIHDKELVIRFLASDRERSIRVFEGLELGSLVATAELDVFDSRQKMVKIILKQEDQARGIKKTVLSFLSEEKKDGPIVQIDSVSKLDEKSTIISFKKNSRSELVNFFLMKYTKSSPTTALVSIVLKGEQGNALEIGGTIDQMQTLSCQGYKLNSTVLVHNVNPYSLEANACTPAFLQVIVGMKGDAKRYDAKLGLQAYKNLVATLTKRMNERSMSLWQKMTFANVDYQPEHKILDLSVRMKKPKLLSVGTHYNGYELDSYYEEMEKWIMDSSLNLKAASVQMFAKIVEESKMELPQMSDLIEIIWNEITEIILNIPEGVLEAIKNIVEKMMSIIHIIIGIGDSIARNVVQVLQSIESSYDSLKSIVEECYEYIQEYFPLTVAMDMLAEAIEYSEETLMSVLHTDFALKMNYNRLDDLLFLYETCIEELLVTFFKARTLVNLFSIEDHGLQYEIPLRYPVASVLETPLFIGSKNNVYQADDDCIKGKIFWAYKNNQMRLLSKQTIELETSKCEYYLAKQDRGAILTMSFPNTGNFSFQVKYGKHEFRHEVMTGRLFIDGVLKNEKNFIVHLSPKFSVSKSGDVFSVAAPGLRWASNLRLKWNRMIRIGCGTGIAYDQNIYHVHKGNYLLSKFITYLVNPQCQPQ